MNICLGVTPCASLSPAAETKFDRICVVNPSLQAVFRALLLLVHIICLLVPMLICLFCVLILPAVVHKINVGRVEPHKVAIHLLSANIQDS